MVKQLLKMVGLALLQLAEQLVFRPWPIEPVLFYTAE